MYGCTLCLVRDVPCSCYRILVELNDAPIPEETDNYEDEELYFASEREAY